jgi:hypothetical protein
VTNAAKLVAKKPGLDVTTVAQLRDLASALVRLCDNGKPAVTVYSDKTMIVCDEKRRAELIQQRERLLALEAGNGKRDGKAIGRETQAAVTALPAPDQSTVIQKDPLILKMESIAKAETWRSEPENHAGNFGPYPEELE